MEIEVIKRHSNKQIFWLISTVLTAGAGGYFMYEADQKYKEYQLSTDSHANDLRKIVNLYDKLSPVLFGLAGISALEFTIQSIKKGKDKHQLKILLDPQGAKLTYNF